MSNKNIVAVVGIVGLALCASAGAVGKSTPLGFTDDFAAAKVEAAKSGRNMLAVFSGSDWCHWCKVLEKNYLSKPEFVEEAKKDFVLVFIDSPQDKSVLSETAKKNNEALTKKYKIKGFPTVKILDVQGEPITDCRPKNGVTPKEYAVQLRREVKVGPLLKKHLAPFEAEMKKAQSDVGAEFMREAKKLDKTKQGEESEKAFFELGQKMGAELVAKYKVLVEKVKAAKVPDEIQTDKNSLEKTLTDAIEQMEQSLKMTWDDVKKMKEVQRTAEEDEADDEADTQVRGLVVPLPKDAKLETEYFENVSMPFYTKWIVDAYRPAADVKPETAERVRAVRRALVRALATARLEFPTHEEFEMAHRLWNEKCRDASVAILHCDGLDGDGRYWQSEKIYNEAVAAFDFAAEPVMGFLLRVKALEAGYDRIGKNKKTSRKPVREANVACSNAFVKVADVFRGADRRIAERLDEQWGLPDGACELIGNEYLTRCHRAKSCMDRASEERGSGWAADLSDEQVKGWCDYNSEARSNLTVAVSLRPEDTRAMMMLASLNARSCGVGDSVALMNRAVSNSLDRAAESIERVLHFKTSRWGGSTEFLIDAIRAATTNVCTQSTFAYRTAAVTLGKIFVAETDNVANTNLANAVLTPEISARLYAMFDAYIAAPESPYMPSRDTFVGMAVSLALQKRDWSAVRKYAALYKKPLNHWKDAWWIRMAVHSSDYGYLINMFKIVGGDPKRRELFIDAEEAMAERRYSEADEIYRKLQAMKGLSEAEKIIACQQGFKMRRMSQETKGGWVDVMPTTSANEAMSWWGRVVSKPDGRARVTGGDKSYYRLLQSLPGKDAEYEASVHFETNDVKQTKWFIGWGMARPYTGFCADNSSWAFPYIGFYRDETGDHVSVECPTRANTGKNKPASKFKYGSEQGVSPEWSVYDGALEKCDTHSFRIRWDDERLTVAVDGKEVWSISSSDVMECMEFCERIQSDYSVLPVWKVFKNTSFSGYRYRLIK